MNWMDVTLCVASLVALAATLRHVWRGGTTLNDHAVAVVVAGCLAVYPTMWLGGRLAGVALAPLLILCVVGVASIWVRQLPASASESRSVSFEFRNLWTELDRPMRPQNA